MPRTAASPPDLQTQQGRLRWAREASGCTSIRAAAMRHGWNENTYKSHEQGIRQAEGLKTATIKKYARAFGVSEEWLAFGKGGPKTTSLTPEELSEVRRLIGKASA